MPSDAMRRLHRLCRKCIDVVPRTSKIMVYHLRFLAPKTDGPGMSGGFFYFHEFLTQKQIAFPMLAHKDTSEAAAPRTVESSDDLSGDGPDLKLIQELCVYIDNYMTI